MPIGAAWNIYKYLPEWKDNPELRKQTLPEPIVYDAKGIESGLRSAGPSGTFGVNKKMLEQMFALMKENGGGGGGGALDPNSRKNTRLLEDMFAKMSRIERMLANGVSFGGGDGELRDDGEELMARLTELAAIIMSPDASDQEKERANYEYDQIGKQFEHSRFFKELTKQNNEELQQKIMDETPIDLEALETLRGLYQSKDKTFVERVTKYKALQVIVLSPNEIKALHKKDYSQLFFLNPLTEQELRAIRAAFPASRDPRDQEFLAHLNARIKDVVEGKAVLEKPAEKADPSSIPEQIDLGVSRSPARVVRLRREVSSLLKRK